ncbi:WSC domain-containing protein [Xylariales sp. AK1849]|nr:WSC domain-containing protein [Xylariales sp. AK1849]
MGNHRNTLLGLLAMASIVEGFWRLTCGTIQTGRIDPIISPGSVASHAHKISGASNFGLSSTSSDLMASSCTSCEIQDDKSAYWTPQLYYQYPNGSFQEVPNGGHVVYYLGRGDNRSNIEPFPPGFRMVSGDSAVRSNDTTTMTYNTANVRGRLQSDRVSFACLDSSGPMPEQNYMFRTDCDQGMRAQIQFQSCWDGRDYQADQSHVAYMSQIDNGVCPPTHPRQLTHLFFEVLYGVNDIKKSDGGRFVFANGDTTGFSFHGDFMNGWDQSVLTSAISQCVNNDSLNGVVTLCPPLVKSHTPYASTNCPEQPAIVNEPVHGMLAALPGCNPVTSGPARAPAQVCPTQPTVNTPAQGSGSNQMVNPAVGDKLSAGSSWAFAGCAADSGSQRTLSGYSFSASNMTVGYCTATCKAQGYPLAGLEYARECYCATTLSSSASYTSPADCQTTPKMTCAGNQTQWCGAPSLLTIWNNTSSSSAAPTKLPGYLGCYAEASGHLLNQASYANATVSVSQCTAYCQAGNYAMIGVEYGGECYCGSTQPASTQLADETTCNMSCKGNTSQICGGSSRISVYNNTLYVPTRNVATVNVNSKPTYKYLSCYTEGKSGRALDKGTSTTDTMKMTVETCATFCLAKNYTYMGVEYGQECYCNNDGPINGASQASETDCSMTCKGDPTEFCGGSSRADLSHCFLIDTSLLYAPQPLMPLDEPTQ